MKKIRMGRRAARATALGICVACASLPARANDPFVVNANVSPGTPAARAASFGFNKAEDAINSLNLVNLGARLAYTGVEVATADVNFRGLPMTLSFPTANNGTLTFVVPALGINQSFVGVGATTQAARDEAIEQLKNFLRKGDFASRIAKRLAELSPVDPVAGNPNSLQSRLAEQDFDNAFMAFASRIIAGGPAANQPNLFGLGLRFGSYSQGGLTSNAYTLPLSYTIKSDEDPRRQLTLTLPVTYNDVEGAKTYHVAAGANYRVPIGDQWALTPAINWGVTGSRDLGSVAQMISVSLTSTYVIELSDNRRISIGNMIGYYKTLKFTVGDYSFDPNIQNVVFRNGLLYSMPTNLLGGGKSLEYSYINTAFTGSALYNKMTHEVGVTLGTNRNANARTYQRLGFNYLFSSKTHGFSLNFGYWF